MRADNSGAGKSRWRLDGVALGIILLLVAGILLRALFLGRASYAIDEINWIQEGMSASSAWELFSHVMRNISFYHHTPYVRLIMRAVIKGSGYPGVFPPEWLVIWPFALLGVATLPFFYLMGKALKDRVTGMWLLFLATFSIFHVFHSREAYVYVMLMFPVPGIVWTTVRLLRFWFEEERFSWRYACAYMFFSSFLLQSHLSGLLFLSPWCVLVAVALLSHRDSCRRLFFSRYLVFWMVTFTCAYILFSPFLVFLLQGGFMDVDNPIKTLPRWLGIPSLLGVMGWGQAWWTLALFSAVLVTGVCGSLTRRQWACRWPVVLVLLQLLVFFVIQTWSLRVSRFAVRYYAAMFPLLLYFAGHGMAFVAECLARRIGRERVILVNGGLAAVLLIWLLPSLWLLMTVDMRMAYNSKMTAEWINNHVPHNGVYCYPSTDIFRAVPRVYPTPGRFATYPAGYNHIGGHYKRLRIRERLTSFFERFPLAVYVETIPADLLGPPDIRTKMEFHEPPPRDMLFARQTWIKDERYQRLVRMKTLPRTLAVWQIPVLDHMLFSYNRPEDLPGLARKRGRTTYHYFGEAWGHHKDPRMNDWRFIREAGEVVAGNATDASISVSLRIKLVAPPQGCQLEMNAQGGRQLGVFDVTAQVADIRVDNVALEPGDNRIQFKIRPLPGRASDVTLLVYAFSVLSPVSASR